MFKKSEIIEKKLKEQNKTKFSTLCLSMENLVNSSLTFNIFFPGNILEKTDIKTAERDHWQDLVWRLDP